MINFLVYFACSCWISIFGFWFMGFACLREWWYGTLELPHFLVRLHFSAAIKSWLSKFFDVMLMWKGCSASYTCWARCSCGQRCSWVRFYFCNSVSSAIHTKGSPISNASSRDFQFYSSPWCWLISCVLRLRLWISFH